MILLRNRIISLLSWVKALLLKTFDMAPHVFSPNVVGELPYNSWLTLFQRFRFDILVKCICTEQPQCNGVTRRRRTSDLVSEMGDKWSRQRAGTTEGTKRRHFSTRQRHCSCRWLQECTSSGKTLITLSLIYLRQGIPERPFEYSLINQSPIVPHHEVVHYI